MERIQEICNLLIYTEIPYRKNLNLDKSIKFGCEIEFENAPKNKVKERLSNLKLLQEWYLDEEWTVEVDYNSIIYGGELVSPKLRDNIQSWRQLKAACNIIKKEFGLIKGSSAGHIHVDASILKDNKEYILNFVALWTVYEHVIYRFAYGEEEEPRKSLENYASPVAPYLYNALYDVYSCLDRITNLYYFLSGYGSLDSYRNGLDFFNCSKVNENQKNTIEIRCPNGSLNEVIWQNNINFFIKLMLYATSDNFDSDFIKQKLKSYKFKKLKDYSNIYLEDAIELSNLIFDKEEDRLYFLKQYLKINVYNKDLLLEKVKGK